MSILTYKPYYVPLKYMFAIEKNDHIRFTYLTTSMMLWNEIDFEVQKAHMLMGLKVHQIGNKNANYLVP